MSVPNLVLRCDHYLMGFSVSQDGGVKVVSLRPKEAMLGQERNRLGAMVASRSSARGPLCTNLRVCCLLVSSLQIPVACWVNCQVVLFLIRVPPGPRIGHGSRADAVAESHLQTQ